MEKNPERTCRGCRHLFVTFKPARPWGCRLLGFESRGLPSAAVRESSGADCLAYERAGAGEAPTRRRG